MRLRDRVAVITGAASGMGKATALRFLAEGASVVMADYNAETGAAALGDAVEQGFGERSRFVRADVAVGGRCREDDRPCRGNLRPSRTWCSTTRASAARFGPLTETRVEDWDYTFDVLVKGVFLGIKHAARIMVPQGRGGEPSSTPPPLPG